MLPRLEQVRPPPPERVLGDALQAVAIAIAVCLCLCIVGIVAIVHRDGVEALAGSGLGALALLLAGALVAVLRRTNGKNGT